VLKYTAKTSDHVYHETFFILSYHQCAKHWQHEHRWSHHWLWTLQLYGQIWPWPHLQWIRYRAPAWWCNIIAQCTVLVRLLTPLFVVCSSTVSISSEKTWVWGRFQLCTIHDWGSCMDLSLCRSDNDVWILALFSFSSWVQQSHKQCSLWLLDSCNVLNVVLFYPNFTDDGGRYAYDRQPAICRWNLCKLAEALAPCLPPEMSKEGLSL